jgi:hypothetical protein
LGNTCWYAAVTSGPGVVGQLRRSRSAVTGTVVIFCDRTGYATVAHSWTAFCRAFVNAVGFAGGLAEVNPNFGYVGLKATSNAAVQLSQMLAEGGLFKPAVNRNKGNDGLDDGSRGTTLERPMHDGLPHRAAAT